MTLYKIVGEILLDENLIVEKEVVSEKSKFLGLGKTTVKTIEVDWEETLKAHEKLALERGAIEEGDYLEYTQCLLISPLLFGCRYAALDFRKLGFKIARDY